MHQDLRVLPVREERAPDARAPGEQRAAEGDDRCYPDDHCEVGLLPPRPRRRGHMARALHHAGRPVIGRGSPALLWRPHMAEWGGGSREVRVPCKNGTRIRSGRRRRGLGLMGPERTAPGRDPWDASFVIFKVFGSQCLDAAAGHKSVL